MVWFGVVRWGKVWYGSWQNFKTANIHKMTDINEAKRQFRILIERLKKKKPITAETEQLCYAFFLEGWKLNEGEYRFLD